MQNLKNLLNPQQFEAVTTMNGPLLVLAGAGTGKTRVITYRIAYMLSQGIPAENILAVTFTNKAANEMKERVSVLLNTKKTRPHISTFHSLGLHILREEIQHFGYRTTFSIYDEADQVSVMKKVVKDIWAHLYDRINIQDVKTAISNYKCQLLTPDMAQAQAKDPENVIYSSVYKEYQHRLKQFNALDYDDLILLPLMLFNERLDILEKFQDRYKYIMIDEYQDTNHSQFLFTQLIAKKYGNICVVGDDDQSIYGWRGADYTNILEFDRHLKNTRVIKLEQNYRSTQTILEAANSVIKNNVQRRAKKLWSAKKNDSAITLHTFPTPRDEAEEIIKEILDAKMRRNLAFNDFAIIMRTNHQSRLFEEQLRRFRVPYVLIGGTKFFDRKEVKDIVAYLNVIINQQDEVSLLRIINTPHRSIGIHTLEILNRFCNANKTSLMGALRQIDHIPAISPKAVQSIKHFLAIISEYETRFAHNEKLAPLIKEFVSEIQYEKEVARVSEDRTEIESRMENIENLIEDIRYFEENEDNRSLRQYLSTMILSNTEKSPEEKLKDSNLTLITLHSCKGLEFPIVYLVGMEEGILPHSRSIDENNGDISEERRICYVGITRAKDELHLSYSLERTKYGETVHSLPSRFLSEIPESLITAAKSYESPEDNSKIAEFYLKKLKQLANS